jgi:hypothetical protein
MTSFARLALNESPTFAELAQIFCSVTREKLEPVGITAEVALFVLTRAGTGADEFSDGADAITVEAAAPRVV